MVFTNGFLFSHCFDLDAHTTLLLESESEGAENLTLEQLSERFDAIDADGNGCEYISSCSNLRVITFFSFAIFDILAPVPSTSFTKV